MKQLYIFYEDVFPIEAYYEEKEDGIFAVIDSGYKNSPLEIELIDQIRSGKYTQKIIKSI